MDVRTAYLEDGPDQYIIREQRVDGILDVCAEMRATGRVGSADGKLAARIPDVVVEHYCNVHGIQFREFIGNPEHARRMMNDPAFALFRVWEGTV